MAKEIKMPQLSDTMDSGKILAWNKSEGDEVNRGDILAEVETDKANLEIESFEQGTLLKILTPAGESANVGQSICVIGEAGETSISNGNGNKAEPEARPAPAPQPIISVPPAVQSASEPESRHQAQEDSVSHSPESNTEQSQQFNGGRIKASPLAKKIARQKNIDLSEIQGSGPEGRILRKDLESVTGNGSTRATTPPSTSSRSPSPAASDRAQSRPASGEGLARPASGEGLVSNGGSLTPLSKMRETIAKRMQQSVNESPHFYTTVSVDMGAAVRLREVLKTKEEYEGISINHMIIKAAAYALSHERTVNRAMRDGQQLDPEQINIGIITALENGLIIPVIHNADRLNLKDLAFEAKAAIDRARAGRPSTSDLTGGTFSISNMGMFDVENFTAIINPGQGAVLAVSSTREVPVVRSGQVTVGKQMKVTLSVDHRVIDGIMSAKFLQHFREALENPALLMV